VERRRTSPSCLAGDVPEPRPNLVVPCPPSPFTIVRSSKVEDNPKQFEFIYEIYELLL
jgi:hypothetical protein